MCVCVLIYLLLNFINKCIYFSCHRQQEHDDKVHISLPLNKNLILITIQHSC